MTSSISGDPFVGREREMAELTEALDDTLEGRGGLIMLMGEPGIGKTRLMEELTAVARSRGTLVAWGASYEAGGTPPYWPWIQAIHSLLAEPSEAILGALNPRAAVIAELVPEIGNIIPGLQSAAQVDSEQARFRLFDSVASFLGEVASSQPMVVVLDDLHWADRSSLDLLEFTAHEVTARPVLVIGGYRDIELTRRHPLSESLAALARARGFRRIPLRGLESVEVERMVKAVGDIPLTAEMIEEIYVRTEGNPFFVSEVTRDLARAAAQYGGDFDAVKFRIPEGVREAVGFRLNKLSEQCNQVLRTAAVIGKDFDFSLLAEVSVGLSEDELLDSIEEALTAGAIRESSSARENYEFTHALIQQTLADEMSASRRMRLHGKVVDALEKLSRSQRDERISELAHHSVEAELVVGVDKVVHYTRMAGESAAASYAWVEARGYFEQALEALGDDVADPVKDARSADRAAVLAGLGKTQLFSLAYPDVQKGWDNIARAFDLHVKLGDSQAAIQTVLQSRGLVPFWVHGTAGVFASALEMVQPGSTEAGHLLKLYASAIRYEQGDTLGSSKFLDQAVEISRRSGDRQLETGILVDQTAFAVIDFDFEGALKLGLQAIELARETGQPAEEATAHFYVASALGNLGDSEAAWKHAEAQRDLHKGTSLQIGAHFIKYLIAYRRGDVVAMDELGEILDNISPDDTPIQMTVGIGAWQAGKYHDLENRIQAARKAAQNDPIMNQRSGSLSVLAAAARLMNRPEDANRTGELAESLLSGDGLTPSDEMNIRETAGLAAVAKGDAQGAMEHYKRLKKLWRRGSAFRGGLFSVDRLLGLLANIARMPEEAAIHFEAALRFSGNAGYRMEEIWACHDYAEALLDSGEVSEVEKATSLIDDGLKISRDLGLIAIEKRLITLQEKAASMFAPAAPYPDGLTSREVEVLRLLAAGRTNQQIADELVIAMNTVTTHVANILSKTSSANRAQAAVYAMEHGLQ
jgi:DNA-binding CsgD family transcriptional regulator